MPDTVEHLGGRLPLLAPDKLTDEQQKIYNYIDTNLVPWARKAGFIPSFSNGRLAGPFNAFLYAPAISQAYLNLLDAEWKNTQLDRRVREVIILTVGAVWNSAYELYAHSAVARHVGISEEAVAALRTGGVHPDLSAPEQTVQRFVQQLCSMYRVDDDLYQQVERAFGTTGVMDIILLTGIYLSTVVILNAFQIPVPPDGQ